MAAIDISSAGGGGSVSTGVLQLQNGVAMDSTLRNVADQNNTTSPLKLSTTGVQIESPLRITTSDASGFYLDCEDSATNNRFSIKRLPAAQEVTLDFASNPAGSTTLVGAIRTYQDGINLSNAMSFIEDGSVGIGTNSPVGILHLYKSAAATRLAIDGDAGFNRLISYRTAGLQRFGLYVNNTAESGSNAGSNFAIRAYSDAGTLLSTPFFINRASGNVGVGTTSPTYKFMVSDNSANDGAVFFEKDLLGGQSDCYVYNKNASTNLTTGQLIGTLTFGGYFNSTFSPNVQDVAAIFGLYTGTGTNRKGQLQFRTHDSSGMQTAMTINDTQLVGIGESSPTARLHIVGKGSTSATTSLLVQNSSGTEIANFRDDLSVRVKSEFRVLDSAGNNAMIMWGDGFGGPKLLWVNGSLGVGVLGNNASAIVQADSTTQGFLPPRMTNAQRLLITTPAIGLMVYCTDAVEGLYVYKSTGWTFVI